MNSAIRWLNDGDIWGILSFHAHHMVTRVDVMHLSGNAAAEIGEEVEACAPPSSMETVLRSGELYSFHFRI